MDNYDIAIFVDANGFSELKIKYSFRREKWPGQVKVNV